MMPVTGLDQRAKTLELDRSRAQARSAPARPPPAPPRARSDAATGSSPSARRHAIATSGASAPTQKATPTPCRNSDRPGQPLRRRGRGMTARGQRQADARHRQRRQHAGNRLDAALRRRHDAGRHRHHGDQQRRPEAGGESRPARAPGSRDRRGQDPAHRGPAAQRGHRAQETDDQGGNDHVRAARAPARSRLAKNTPPTPTNSPR